MAAGTAIISAIPGANWVRSHKDVALYTASSLARTAAQLIASLITVRLIAPEELGLWNSISLAGTYAFFLQAGVLSGLGRDLPFHLGAGHEATALKLAGTSQSFTLGGNILVLVGGLIALVLFWDRGPAVQLAILCVTAITVGTFYQNYLFVTFRSKISFLDLGKTQFWAAGLMVATLPVLMFWGYDGLLLRGVLVTAAVVWLMHRVRPIRVGHTWDGAAFKSLMITGLPLFAMGYIDTITMTMDRLVLLKQGGVQQVGYYSLAMYASQAMTIIPVSLGQYVYPRMSYLYGKDGDPRILWTMAWKTAVGTFLIMTPIALACAFALPYLVPFLFPKYAPGVPAAQIFLFGSIFIGAVIGVNALFSMKAWKHYVAYEFSCSALRVACPIAGALFLSSPLVGVAWGMFTANAAGLLVGLMLIYSATRTNPAHRADG